MLLPGLSLILHFGVFNFPLRGSLVQVERWLERRGTPVNRVPWIGRAWTLAWLFLPLGVLFPPPFLQGVVWPIAGIEPARTP